MNDPSLTMILEPDINSVPSMEIETVEVRVYQ